jgi:hypothetical protein
MLTPRGSTGGLLLTPRASVGDLVSRRKTSEDLPLARLLEGRAPDCGPARAIASTAALQFSFIMEEPSIDSEEGSKVCFNARVICHDRPHRDRAGDKNADREYAWWARWRFSDFEELDRGLRAAHALPAAAVLPKRTTLRQWIQWMPNKWMPNKDFARERSGQLSTYLSTVLAGAEAQVEAAPARFNDVADVSSALPRFFGLQDKSGSVSDTGGSTFRRAWSYPDGAEERPTALVYPMCRGAYVWNHNFNAASSDSKIEKKDSAATLGDIDAIRGELRGVVLRGVQPPAAACYSGLASPGTGSQRQSLQRCYSPMSPGSSPEASRLPSTSPSPAVSPPLSPRQRSSSSCGGTTDSFSSASTADTNSGVQWEMEVKEEPPFKVRPQDMKVKMDVVWLEVNLDTATRRQQEHARWWASLDSKASARLGSQEQAKIPGARQVDGAQPAGARLQDGRRATAPTLRATPAPKEIERERVEARRRAAIALEASAAVFRELSAVHEDLHPILSYGTDKSTDKFVVCLQAAPDHTTLRGLQFTPQRCHCVVGQALKALQHLHRQSHAHGHLSPESFLIDETPLGPQVRLAWTPGQHRRTHGGRTLVTLGFRAPERVAGLPSDVWALASVILAWWQSFSPVPHPWTQFSRDCTKLQQEINQALSERPPQMPQALLELHAAAATAEEPGHTFLSLLASLLTRCFIWEPEKRPTVAELLGHAFFEQAL